MFGQNCDARRRIIELWGTKGTLALQTIDFKLKIVTLIDGK